jgi:hypothetical protein
VVTACLAALAMLLGDGVIRVSSDGAAGDWHAGCELASRVLKREVPVPPQVGV